MPDKKTTLGAFLGLYAQTSLHPGSGAALGTVDLPVQRERHTKWPIVAGSALKGILRDTCREEIMGQNGNNREEADKDLKLEGVFGPNTKEADKHAGALSVMDARILAFPVRSLKGVFAWATCPGVLDRLMRDAAIAGLEPPVDIPRPGIGKAVLSVDGKDFLYENRIVLEEFDFEKTEGSSDEWAAWIAVNLLPAEEKAFQPSLDRFRRSLVVLHDDDFTHFVRYGTEVSARIKLSYETKTVDRGALFYQEFLPPETLFYTVLLAHETRARGANKMNAREVVDVVKEHLPLILQVGGDETTGKGFCATNLSIAAGGGK